MLERKDKVNFKKVLLTLICILLLGAFTGCVNEDDNEDKRSNEHEETLDINEKADEEIDEENDEEDDKANDKENGKETNGETDKETTGKTEDEPENIGDTLDDKVNESKKNMDDASCNIIRTAFNYSMVDEVACQEMVSKDGKMWILITFKDGLVFSGSAEFTALERQLRERLDILDEPYVKGRVGYLVTWLTNGGKIVGEVKVVTVDGREVANYLSHLGDVADDIEDEEIADEQPNEDEKYELQELGLEDASRFVFDEADLISEEAEGELNNLCAKYSYVYDSDIVIVAVDKYEGNIDEAYKDVETQRYGDYDKKCCDILFVDMNTREIRIFSYQGETSEGKYLNDEQCDEICDVIIPDLSKGYYKEAFNKYLEMIKEYYEA